MIDQTPIEPEDKELDVLVRDLTKAHPLPKSEVKARVLAWADRRIKEAELKARFVELDLLEQALNDGWDMRKYKLVRLSDLEWRLNNIKEDS